GRPEAARGGGGRRRGWRPARAGRRPHWPCRPGCLPRRHPDVHEPARRSHSDRGGDPVRAVIADDSVLLREGITRPLGEGGIAVSASVGDAAALLAAIAADRPDLAIIDVRMPPGHRDEGLRAALEIRRRWPDVALLVLSQFVEERYATELLSE